MNYAERRNQGGANELERDAGGGRRSRRGRAVFMVVEQSGEVVSEAPSLIEGET